MNISKFWAGRSGTEKIFDFGADCGYAPDMIKAIPNKQRFQVFKDHACPGQFEFVADFSNDIKACHFAEKTHLGHMYGDMVVLDAERGTLILTLSGKRTLTGSPV